jgi:hypothetical protein
MNRALWLSAALLALGTAGCNSGGDSPPANVSANASSEALENAAAAGNEAEIAGAALPGNASAGNSAAGEGAAASLCLFEPGDVKDWKAVQGKNGTRTAGMVIVTGKARVGDPKYMARLTRTEVGSGILRLWLTRAEQEFPEEVPEDGWYDLRYGPGETGIRKVVVSCDRETSLAELDVEGAK